MNCKLCKAPIEHKNSVPLTKDAQGIVGLPFAALADNPASMLISAMVVKMSPHRACYKCVRGILKAMHEAMGEGESNDLKENEIFSLSE